MPGYAFSRPENNDWWFRSDKQMHHLYPKSIQALADTHWTPLDITRLALDYLVPTPGVKILDIGSGVGKFALAGAHLKPNAFFFGVEQRRDLVGHAEAARKILGLENVHFFLRNFAQLQFRAFDHFYFYNSFYENLLDTDRIDHRIICCPDLYSHYHGILQKKLNAMPSGTRVVTYHCLEGTMPPGYRLVGEPVRSVLRFWIRV